MQIAPIAPYRALYEQMKSNSECGLSSTWQPCRVVGITMNDEGEPEYVVETAGNTACLITVSYIRHPAPTA